MHDLVSIFNDIRRKPLWEVGEPTDHRKTGKRHHVTMPWNTVRLNEGYELAAPCNNIATNDIIEGDLVGVDLGLAPRIDVEDL